ncbi:MAG: hypothetical protein U1A72_10670, partial [Sulfuritalea sp.]|nr:hypothetical protein [Sulfuritalea sp.]
ALNTTYGTKMQVHVYDELPLWRILVFGGTMHVSYFTGGKQGIETPVLELKKSHDKDKSTIYQAFESHIRELWNTRSKNAI